MGVRAFQDDRYDYYELTQSLGLHGKKNEYILPAGSIFYHDKEDFVHGSIGDGCLKLCWTPDGNCYGWICGDCMTFHAQFKYTDLFRLIRHEPHDRNVKQLQDTVKELEEKLESAKKQLKELSL